MSGIIASLIICLSVLAITVYWEHRDSIEDDHDDKNGDKR